MYPGNFNLYKEPAQFSVASTDPDSDLDYSQWIHPGPVLDHHEAYEHFPMVDGQDPYSHAAGHSSYQGHRNWSMPGDTWTEAINEEHYILRSQEPFMELKDVGSYAEINDVSSNVPRLIPEAQPYFQGYMSDNVNMQPGPSQTAGFVSNEMDFVPMQASYGYEDRLAQDARVLYQDQTQQDCQDHTPGYYLQDPYYQGQTHGYPESAAQDQALFRKTHHVLSSPCLDDVGSSRARAVGAEHTANASSRAYRSNTGPRLMPKEDRILSQHASSHANHHTMAPLESFDGHRRRDSVQTSHSSSSSKPEGGQRTDPLYKAQPHPIDKLYHCPFRGRVQCKHDPTNLKCNYDKYIDSHLKPFKCKHNACANFSFSSTACLLRHEREAHGLHGHGTKPNLCPYQDCDRSRPEHGFPRAYNLRDHMKRVHKDGGEEIAETPIKEEKGPRRSKRGTGTGSSKRRAL